VLANVVDSEQPHARQALLDRQRNRPRQTLRGRRIDAGRRQATDETLATRRAQHGRPQRKQTPDATHQLRVLPDRLSESQARVQHHVIGVNPRLRRGPAPTRKEHRDLANHVRVGRLGRVPVGVRVQVRRNEAVHQDHPRSALRDKPQHRRVLFARRHVIDGVRSGVQRGPSDRGTRRVDADRDARQRPAGGPDRSHRRDDARDLLLRGHTRRARPRGLAAEVERIRAVAHRLPRRLHGRGWRGDPARPVETVRREIQDRHDARSIERDRPAVRQTPDGVRHPAQHTPSARRTKTARALAARAV